MRLMPRDIRLVRDISLSHVLTRDQVLRLGYFASIPRANSRLKVLCDASLLTVHELPFSQRYHYSAGSEASRVVGDRVAAVLSGRRGSPQFIRHALFTTETRLAYQRLGFLHWRFEAQLRRSFRWAGREWHVRPDGLVSEGSTGICIEVDLGHVSAEKFQEKLAGFDALLHSGLLSSAWGFSHLAVHTVTVSERRKTNLEKIASGRTVDCQFVTLADLGIPSMEGWS